MKKQMRYIPHKWPYTIIQIYHDGQLVAEKLLFQDEVSDYVEELEQQGYTKGYTKLEVEQSKQIYENQLQNIIKEI